MGARTRPDLDGEVRPAPAADASSAARVLLLALVTGVATAVLAWRAGVVAADLAPLRVEDCLELLALAVGILAAGWLALASLLALLCVLVRAGGRSWARGERLLVRHAPAVVRRAARVGVSLSVGAGLVLGAGTAQAAELEPPEQQSAVAVDLGWREAPAAATADARQTPAAADAGQKPESVPDPAAAADHGGGTARPAPSPSSTTTGASTSTSTTETVVENAPTSAPDTPEAASARGTDVPAPAPAAAAAAPSVPAQTRDAVLTVRRAQQPAPTGTTNPAEVVVVRGDNLWSIAARQLPADASAADVGAEVERWYAANRGVVGDDPDLIRPGQVLVPPPA
ncbi:LysM peptidoglycan-binding domain-containing protein [Cellulosimicrobium arenosum]|uniref:LysM peptidoglycan-binding domain-containing protein n=1 Tax=Cellulosimicrobium arenosum TaxID=2708133 RepID=A0A927J2N1_9MICO|nr:LysM domain-containing protein [Cellulosimicrobium arenosum]MBD8080712.1 LysM peptidoglycan-binding domain-containing protein [Cellulosimicrobium arenosum]